MPGVAAPPVQTISLYSEVENAAGGGVDQARIVDDVVDPQSAAGAGFENAGIVDGVAGIEDEQPGTRDALSRRDHLIRCRLDRAIDAVDEGERAVTVVSNRTAAADRVVDIGQRRARARGNDQIVAGRTDHLDLAAAQQKNIAGNGQRGIEPGGIELDDFLNYRSYRCP